MTDTVEQFAARLKKKYPDYKSVPDRELVEKVLSKHPEYRSQVELDDPYISNLNKIRDSAPSESQARAVSPLVDTLSRTVKGSGDAVHGLFVDTPKAIVHAAKDPVTEDEKKRYGADTRRSPGLVVSRMVADPMLEEKRKRDAAMAQGHTSEAVGHELAGDIPLIGPWAAGLGERAGSGDIAGAASEGITSWFLPHAVSPLLKGAGKVANISSKYAPTAVTIEGVEVPVLIDEAHPGSKVGNKGEAIKASGVGRDKFIEVRKQQSEAVKDVIRKVSQQTSQMIGPMPESVTGAVEQAGDALHAKARPMYHALDLQLINVPNIYLKDLDGVMQKAVNKVKELGGQIPEPSQLRSGNVQFPRQPLSDYMDVRSRLLKIGRETSDDAVRSAVWDNVNTMDAEIEKALTSTKIPGLVDNWRTANALWRRGYALQRVAEGIGRAEKGSPVEFQPQGVDVVPPRILGKTLVSELKKMDAKGDLSRAFGDSPSGQSHIKSIRDVAALLDRSQGAKIGRAKDIEGIKVIKRIKRLGQQRIAKAMTTPQGASSVFNYLSAKTATDEFKWAGRISSVLSKGRVQPPPGAQADTQ
jgi:hypothetical protein